MIGYARVSTTGQSLEAQLAELKAAGATKIFQEKISGKNADRRELQKALRALGPDDVLIVTKLDRLARSSRDLLNIVSQITEVGASFKSLRDQCADTTTPTGRMILTVLSGIAEFERELINERTGEGRTRARERRSVRPAFEAVDVPASRSFTTERKPASR